MFVVGCFWLENFDQSLLHKKLWLIFMRMKKKSVFFWKYVIQNYRLKKMSFTKMPILNIFESLRDVVSRINWCERHQCCSMDMVVRLSDVRYEIDKNSIFCVFSNNRKSLSTYPITKRGSSTYVSIKHEENQFSDVMTLI